MTPTVARLIFRSVLQGTAKLMMVRIVREPNGRYCANDPAPKILPSRCSSHFLIPVGAQTAPNSRRKSFQHGPSNDPRSHQSTKTEASTCVDLRAYAETSNGENGLYWPGLTEGHSLENF